MTAAGWTIPEAVAEFHLAGRPVDPRRFRMAIRALQIQPTGETTSGRRGGRGHALYDIGQLQQLHAVFFAPWLTARDEPQAGHHG